MNGRRMKKKKKKNNVTLCKQKFVNDVDCDDYHDKWKCIKKECSCNSKNEYNFVSTNTLDDVDVVDDDNIEYIDCVYHNHNEEEKSMSIKFGDSFTKNDFHMLHFYK